MDPVCQTCGYQGESVNHLVFTCPVARQVWALANIPVPCQGFNHNSYYFNFAHLLELWGKKKVPKKIIRTFPWIIWFLWKNRNGVCFDGIAKQPDELIQKVIEEVDFWFLAQIQEEELNKIEQNQKKRVAKRWSPPNAGWLKCWVVKMQCCRRAFVNCPNMHEARFQCLIWATESMVYHRLNKVLFAMEDTTLIGLITRPAAWPSFRYQSKELLCRLAKMEWWRIVLEDKIANIWAFLISQSVTKYRNIQSYVAYGAPEWLRQLFENEKSLPCV
ncbi:hypothetical protein N665_0225s0007 [Sinapis alba]|nr:hypothetical protein N665_0225s0007 [Sinapis alba]